MPAKNQIPYLKTPSRTPAINGKKIKVKIEFTEALIQNFKRWSLTVNGMGRHVARVRCFIKEPKQVRWTTTPYTKHYNTKTIQGRTYQTMYRYEDDRLRTSTFDIETEEAINDFFLDMKVECKDEIMDIESSNNEPLVLAIINIYADDELIETRKMRSTQRQAPPDSTRYLTHVDGTVLLALRDL